ncbi:MAG: hypothetical protein P8171_03340 [Candidatus Thiodiazotropha sp.]
MEKRLQFRNSVTGIIITYFLLAFLLTSCGGSSGDTNQDDPNADDPVQSDPVQDDPQPSDPDPDVPTSVPTKVSDIKTLATPDTPIAVFSEEGDGMVVWTVQSEGVWIYYSYYDKTSGEWGESQQLVPVMPDNYVIDLRLVSGRNGFALAWMGMDQQLHARLFDNKEWGSEYTLSGDQLGIIDYELKSNGTGFMFAWMEHDNPDYSDPRNYAIKAAVSYDGSEWDDTTIVDTSNDVEFNRLSLESNGTDYLVTWAERDAYLYGRIYAGNAWQITQELISPLDGFFRSIKVLVATNGQGYTLAWPSGTQNTRSILNRTYTVSDGWSEVKTIHSFLDDYTLELQEITSNGTGYCITVVSNNDDQLMYDYYAIIDSDGSGHWGNASLLKSFDWNNEIRQTALVSDGIGYATAWSYFAIGRDAVDYFASIFMDGVWHLKEDPIASIAISSYQQMQSKVPDGKTVALAGQNSEYVLAISQNSDGVDSVSGLIYDENGWGDPVAMETGIGNSLNPIVVDTEQSGISVIWHQLSDTSSSISTYYNQRRDGQWSGRELLAEGNYFQGSSHDTKLITNKNGQTLALWVQDRNGYRSLFANIHDGTNWGNPVVLSDSITDMQPQVASNTTGFAITWEESINQQINLMSVVFDADDWGVQISQNINQIKQSGLSIPNSLVSNGVDYILIYLERIDVDASENNLYAQYFNGSGWQEPEVLSGRAYNYSNYLQVETNGTTYSAVWLQDDDGVINIYASMFDGQSWADKQLIDADLEKIYFDSPATYFTAVSPDVPQLASNGSSYGVFWIDRGKIKSRFYLDAWSSAMVVGDIEQIAWKSGITPQVTSNGVEYAVAWTSENDSGSRVFVNRFDGTSWSGPVDISGTITHSVLFDMLDDSTLITAFGDEFSVIWGEYDMSNEVGNNSLLYSCVSKDESWSSKVLLNEPTANQIQFQLASDGTGMLVAWLGDGGTGKIDLFTKKYDGSTWSDLGVIDENELSKYDLSLLGTPNGYQAIWNSADPEGDPWVRIPWAMTRL